MTRFVLVLLHAPGKDTDAQIDAIRASYRTRFQQEAVMKVTSKAQVAF